MISQIFSEEPHQWGLRGDSYLWKDMEEYFASKKLPKSEDEFEKLFRDAFKVLTGEALTPNTRFFREKYSHGGMSSGYIDSNFWLNDALPLLKTRLKNRIK